MKARLALAVMALGSLACPAALADKKPQLQILTVAQADDRLVRHSEGSAIELKDGSLLLCWQEFRHGQGDSDFFPNRLVCKTSKDGGRTWGRYRVLVEPQAGDVNVFSPNFVRLGNGDILFVFMRYLSFAQAQNKYPPTAAAAWISRDDGRTFQPHTTLWQNTYNSFASSVVKRASTGRLLLPLNRDQSKKGQPDHWEGGLAYSDDDGKTWKESRVWIDLPLRGVMETHVEELRDGRLLMIMRNQLGAIFQSHSSDGGDSWSKPQTTGLKSPESCPDLVKIPRTGDLMIIWNNSLYDPKYYSHFGKRTPLTVAVSRDDGRSWSNPRNIESDPAWAYSNPGCCFTSKGTVFINYWACKYQPSGAMSNFPIHLKAAIVDVDWLYGKD